MIRDRALVIAVYLPERCKGVLFIENQDTYIAAAAGSPTEALEFALVYAAGFRGTAARVRWLMAEWSCIAEDNVVT
jgi:hypothetical protein